MPRAIGVRRAKEAVFTGAPFGADDALALGLGQPRLPEGPAIAGRDHDAGQAHSRQRAAGGALPSEEGARPSARRWTCAPASFEIEAYSRLVVHRRPAWKASAPSTKSARRASPGDEQNGRFHALKTCACARSACATGCRASRRSCPRPPSWPGSTPSSPPACARSRSAPSAGQAHAAVRRRARGGAPRAGHRRPDRGGAGAQRARRRARSTRRAPSSTTSPRPAKATTAPTCAARARNRWKASGEVAQLARGAGTLLVGGVSTAFGCTIEGPSRTRPCCSWCAIISTRAREIVLGDTVGLRRPVLDPQAARARAARDGRRAGRAAPARHARPGPGQRGGRPGHGHPRLRRLGWAAWAAARTRPGPAATSSPRTRPSCLQAMGWHTGVDIPALLRVRQRDPPGAAGRGTAGRDGEGGLPLGYPGARAPAPHY